MLAALTLAAATALPTLPIAVHTSPSVSRSLATSALEEAAAIWRNAGVRLVWTIVDEKGGSPRALPSGAAPDVLRVLIDDDPGTTLDIGVAIGWVNFYDDEPHPEIHLSYLNAVTGLARACPPGALGRMMRSELDEVVAIGLGRALAHELGHYLLGSKVHSGKGLMHADWSPTELFGADRPFLGLDAVQREALASKLVTSALVTKR